MRTIAAVALVLAACAAQAGEVYKWKDKDGNVHYGDKPRHEAAMVEIADDQPDADVRSTDVARSAECQRQRDQLESYRKAGKIAEKDNLGNTREYSDAEKEKFIALTEQKVATACAPATAAAPPAQ